MHPYTLGNITYRTYNPVHTVLSSTGWSQTVLLTTAHTPQGKQYRKRLRPVFSFSRTERHCFERLADEYCNIRTCPNSVDMKIMQVIDLFHPIFRCEFEMRELMNFQLCTVFKGESMNFESLFME